MFKKVTFALIMLFYPNIIFSGDFSTYPNKPKVKEVPSQNEIRPERDIPVDFDKISWKITGTKDGITFAKDIAPIFSFNNDGLPITVGTIPIGSDVKIYGFRVLSRKIYYAIQSEGMESGSVKSGDATYKVSRSSVLASNEVNNVKWVAGIYLEASGFLSDGQ